MKNKITLKLIKLGFFVMLSTYLCVAFVELKINPFQISLKGRATIVVIYFFFLCLIPLLKDSIKNNKDEN